MLKVGIDGGLSSVKGGGEEKTHYDVDWRKTSVVKENRYDNNYRYV